MKETQNNPSVPGMLLENKLTDMLLENNARYLFFRLLLQKPGWVQDPQLEASSFDLPLYVKLGPKCLSEYDMSTPWVSYANNSVIYISARRC